MRDVYAEVTNTIIKAIEDNPGEVMLPWNRDGGGMPINVTTNKFYNGINVLHLWCMSQTKGFNSGSWATFKQWRDYGACVKKGAKASPIIFYKQVMKKDDNGKDTPFRMLRHYSVFNANQVDGYDDPVMTGDPIDRINAADEHVRKTGAIIECSGAVACYHPATDKIGMPDEQRFFDTETSTRTEAYYSTLLHELTHWTGKDTRCNRDMGKRFGKEAYAMEELVAELGAAYQCVKLGITPEPRIDHAQYINNWLQVLKNDKKAIFTAAAKAQEAVDYLCER